MSTDAGRLAAYADLVAAVLDLRSPATRDTFDDAILEAQRAGGISDDLARQLRWLQRQNERALVEHAESVLPPALVALDRSAADAVPSLAGVLPTLAQAAASGATAPGVPTVDHPDDSPADDAAPVVDLQARRLLVAGLRPIAHTHRSGSDTIVTPAPAVPPVPADPGL